ncbi:MAG: hypothetical protein ACHP7O_04950 [Burkholderiales bacterium]
MNTLTDLLPFLSDEPNGQIVEFSTDTEELAIATRRMPMEVFWLRGVLKGYEASMRRHAASCEAGR